MMEIYCIATDMVKQVGRSHDDIDCTATDVVDGVHGIYSMTNEIEERNVFESIESEDAKQGRALKLVALTSPRLCVQHALCAHVSEFLWECMCNACGRNRFWQEQKIKSKFKCGKSAGTKYCGNKDGFSDV